VNLDNQILKKLMKKIKKIKKIKNNLKINFFFLINESIILAFYSSNCYANSLFSINVNF
jgi:hypothetical protein